VTGQGHGVVKLVIPQRLGGLLFQAADFGLFPDAGVFQLAERLVSPL
jgi:hypothetical protein